MTRPIYLGVNVDHVATVREARGTTYPDPVHAALQAEMASADSITMHLREDRRHIQDHDVDRFAASLQTKLNLEMAATDEMLAIALRIKPADSCIVPEKREELTTEGGLDAKGNLARINDLVQALSENAIRTSLFIDPDFSQIEAAKQSGAPVIELHTGRYADTDDDVERLHELKQIEKAALHADSLGLIVNAGHGLHYHNVQSIAAIPCINELNIGHALIARSLFDGIQTATREMKRLMNEARFSL